MEAQQVTESKKRTLGFMLAGEVAYKLKSKADFLTYLDQHLQFYLPPATAINKDFQ